MDAEIENSLIQRAKQMIICQASAVGDMQSIVFEDLSTNKFYNFIYENRNGKWKCTRVRGTKPVFREGEKIPFYITDELKKPLENGVELGNFLMGGNPKTRLKGLFGNNIEYSRE